jgi:diguanylate cyclase (GGDEF)-like protein/PAS domain S-box-containing protein
MRKYWQSNDSEFGLRFYAILLMCCWTLVVTFSIYWRINQESQIKVYLAREVARSHLEKDLIIREWNMNHGFVYAPVNPENLPNPLLKMPEREIVSPSGRTFTAINSSTMIQQIYKLAGGKIAYQGHLTSLRPLRPENSPDSWEKQALMQLENGAKEVSDIVNKNEKLYFRLIRPLIARDKCLACHSQTDYTAGKVAGGISITLPMASVVDAWQITKFSVIAAHGFLWLIGLLGIAWGAEQLHKKIQAKQEIEMALRQSENNYRLLVKNIPALVYRGYADGRVDFVDDKVEHLTGYSQEQFFTGHIKWPDIIVSEDRKGSKEIFLHALKADGAYRREYRIKRKDNEIVWVAESSQIVWDAQARIEFISGVVLDISLQKDMEQSLKESERFWRTLLEAVGVGLMVIDKANGRITEVNSQALAMSGFSREQIIGQERQRFFMCPLKSNKIVNSPEWRENCSEGKLIKADGTLLPILKTVAPIQIGEMQHLIISFLDLTDQRQAENALIKANEDLQAAMAEVGQTNKEMILMGKMLELLQICQSPDEAYPVIAQYTQELFPNSSGALFLLNSSNNLVASVSQWGQALAGKTSFSPIDCWALRQSRPYFYRTPSTGSFTPKCYHIPADVNGSHLCMPLTAQGETIGLFYLEKINLPEETIGVDKSGNYFDKLQEKLARTLAEHISLSLANLKLRETLRHQAIRDALTGLFNRRYLQETLGREIHRAQRQNTTLGVIMLDVDNFKIFNDTNGHEAGDRLLAVFGRYLRDSIRAEDIACRYGGEEFTLILPDISPEVLLKRAEMIRVGTKNLEVFHYGKVLGGVTISLGLSYFPHHGNDADSLLQAADAALYQAKRSGRDRVVMAGSQPQVLTTGGRAA